MFGLNDPSSAESCNTPNTMNMFGQNGGGDGECSINNNNNSIDNINEILLQRLMIWGLFLRGVGFVLCLSYVSISFQIVPLAGKNGVTPLTLFLKALKKDFPSSFSRFFKFPTIFWLIGSSDFALRATVACGFFATFAAILGLGGMYNSILFAIGWMIYLSLNYAIGLTFPWDAFLLEASFLNIFMPPLVNVMNNSSDNNSSVSITELPDPLLQFLYRYLLGRLMLGFGKLKFLGTNAKHHCYIKGFLIGQPIPTRLGWLGYHLPVAVHKFALVVMFIVEMIMPFLLYVGGLYKLSAGISFFALMIGIQITGNFGYFNLLTTMMSIQTLDVHSILTWKEFCLMERSMAATTTITSPMMFTINTYIIPILYIFILLGGCGSFVFNSWCNNSWMDWPVVANLKGFLGYLVNFYRIFSPFKIVNSYGVFPPTSAPPLRWVVVLEGKAHNGKWKKYHWRFMSSHGGQLENDGVDDEEGYDNEPPPAFVAPHHPRIDHSVFYNAVGMDNSNYLSTVTLGIPHRFSPKAPMLLRVMARLLKGGKGVKDLSNCFFSYNPFPDFEKKPPNAMRVSLYCYYPTTMKEWWNSGMNKYYTRKKVGEHIPATTLKDIDDEKFWNPPAELFHVDSTVSWKQNIGLLKKIQLAKNSVDICINYGSSKERCGGISIVEEDVLDLFWNNWIGDFCTAYSDVLLMPKKESFMDLSMMNEADPKWLSNGAFMMKKKYTKEQLHKLELILSRLSYALVKQWMPIYFKEGGVENTKYGNELHLNLTESISNNSFFALEMLAHHIILNGKESFESAWKNPVDAALNFSNKVSNESGLLLQALLRIEIFRFHGRKFLIAKSFSMDDDDNKKKKTMQKKDGKEEEKIADGKKNKNVEEVKDSVEIPVVPGFLLLNKWFCKPQTQSALGILNDQKLPALRKPTEGGEWHVFWKAYFNSGKMK